MEELVAVGVVSLLTGVLLGRYTKRPEGIKNYQQIMSQLNEKSRQVLVDKLKYSMYYSRLKLISRSCLAAVCLAIAGLVYYNKLHLLSGSPMVVIVISNVTVYSLTYFFYWLTEHSEKRLKIYNEDIQIKKHSIVKELGEDIIDAVKADDKCSKECQERNKALEDKLVNHQKFIHELASFQWCDACAQDRFCSSKCGAKFWNFTKVALRTHNLLKK